MLFVRTFFFYGLYDIVLKYAQTLFFPAPDRTLFVSCDVCLLSTTRISITTSRTMDTSFKPNQSQHIARHLPNARTFFLFGQSDRDAEVIKADEACDKAATELENGRKAKFKAAWKKQREVFGRRRAERADVWAGQLSIQVRRVIICYCWDIAFCLTTACIHIPQTRRNPRKLERKNYFFESGMIL